MKARLERRTGAKLLGTIALAVLTLTPLFFQTWVTYKSGVLMGDFRAFYCAAKVAASAENPYRNTPLHSCEAAVAPVSYVAQNRNFTLPAPLPGYTIAAFMPLSALPFTVAAVIWGLILILAWIVCVAAVTRLCSLRLSTGLAIFAFSVGLSAVPFGETAPITIAAICAAALLAREGRWGAAGVAAAVSMLEPHLGLPVCAALAIWGPQTRIPLLISAVLLGAVSLVTLGLAANLEYLTSVLPAQALSEAASDAQYSLTTVLASAGVNAMTAVRAGSLWYAAMLLLGCAAAGAAAHRMRNPAFLVCVPVAFAVFGGAYVHITQIAAALPAGLLMVRYSENARIRTVAAISLLLLAVPWGWASPIFLIVPLFPITWLAWDIWAAQIRAVVFAALAAALLIAGLNYATTFQEKHPTGTHYSAPSINRNLAEAPWSDSSRLHSATNSLATWLPRIPTWVGLTLLLYAILAESGIWDFLRGGARYSVTA